MTLITYKNILNKSENKKKILLIFLWIIFLTIGVILKSILLPFLLAGLLTFVLDPIITKINKIKINKYHTPRWLGVLITYLIIATTISLLAAFFIPEIYKEIINLTKEITFALNNFDEISIQEYTKKIDNILKRYNIPIEIITNPSFKDAQTTHIRNNLISIDLSQILKELLTELAKFIHNEFSDIILQLQTIITRIFDFFLQLVLIFMITGFLLVDTKSIYNTFLNLNLKKNNNYLKIVLKKIDIGLSGVVRGQLIICLINALLTLAGLLMLKIKFSFLLATLAGIFSVVPIFGSIMSTIPIFLIGLTSSIYTGFLALIWIIIIHAIEANILNPKIMGNSSKIHPVLIILSLVSGKYYYGIVGALLSVPITSIILTIIRSIITKTKKL